MGIRNIAVTITANSSDLRKALLIGSSDVQKFTREVESSNRRTGLSWQTAGVAAKAGVVGVALAVGAASFAAAQFETRMRNVNSLVHESPAAFKQMSASVLDLSTKLPQSANTLAEGLYDVTSSGFAGAEALGILQKAAEAASAGLTTTANAAQAIDAVLNAYGLSAASAADVSDTLFQTVNLGVINFEQLTGTIGDVVGTAAAAKVSISQVGAAIATLTLSGLSGAESGTSLNRVIQSLIQPSEALAAVYKNLGIESGAQELATKGLFGVMEELRKATGGNITTMLQLFPEIRAARGALALMSNEGRTYARVSKSIDDENARQGATHKALAEQMKATSFQLKLFENQATRSAIKVGAQVLPVFLAFLVATQHLGQEAVPLLQHGVSAITPLFEALYKTGANVVQITGELLHAVEPLAAAFLAVGGSAIIGGLTVLAKTLEHVTGFLAEHKTLVQALAAVYLATLLPSVTAVTIAFNRFILTPVVLGLSNLIGAAAGASTSLGALTASMLSLQAVATFGVALALFAVFRGYSQLHKAQAEAKQDVDQVKAGFNTLDTSRAQQQIADLREIQLKAIETGNKFSGIAGTWRAGWNTLAGDNSVAKIAAAGRDASEALEELQGKVRNTNANLVALANSTGLTVESLRKFALSKNIDLSPQFFSDDASNARKQILGALKDIEKQSGTTGTALQHAAGIDLEAVQALAAALTDVQKKVKDAFQRDTDVFAGFDPTGAAEASSKASDKVAAAERRLSDARERAASHTKQSVSDTIAIRNAQDALAKAQEGVAAGADKESGDLAASYRRTIALATHFADDVQKAQARGLDPSAITRLLELGPKQAEPILQRLVADHSGRLIKLVNDSEAALARIGERVVEQARLTTLATNAATDELSRNLTTALKISGEALGEGSKATVQSVAKAIGVPDATVRRIALLYGITLRDTIQHGLNSKPLVAPTLSFVNPAERHDPDYIHRTGGGPVYGAGTATSDSILMRASHGEYVQRAAAVDYYGVAFMDRLNRLQLPRYAGGGLVGGQVVRVDGGTTHSVTHRQDVNGPVIVQGVDMDDAFRQLERKKRARGWSGGAR